MYPACMDPLRHGLQLEARTALGEHLQEALRRGVPDLGFDGDPWLTVYFNKLTESFEVWHERPGAKPYRCYTGKTRDQLHLNVICAHLRDHDAHKGNNALVVAERVEASNAAVAAEQDRKADDKIAEVADKGAWDLGRRFDFGSRQFYVP